MTNIDKGIRRGLRIAAALALLVPLQAAAQLLDRTALDALLENAQSPADHTKLAEHYAAQAKELQARSDDHRTIGAKYRRKGLPPKSEATWKHMNRHCDNLAKAFASAATESTELAAMHRSMAEKAR